MTLLNAPTANVRATDIASAREAWGPQRKALGGAQPGAERL